jgi:hypothetical protein
MSMKRANSTTKFVHSCRALASPILGARKSRPGYECPGDPPIRPKCDVRGRDPQRPLNVDSSRPVSVEILWGESRRLIRFGFGTVTGERPMLQENEGTISTQDQPTGSDIFVSVEISRSKWVVGIHTPLADKIGLHTMACGDVEALMALIDRASPWRTCHSLTVR